MRLMDPERSVLVLVDYQQRLLPAIHRGAEVLAQAVRIADVARELASDLLVISTHGYTGLKHVLMGSIAEHVVRYAPCPVLVVRQQEQEFVQTPEA